MLLAPCPLCQDKTGTRWSSTRYLPDRVAPEKLLCTHWLVSAAHALGWSRNKAVVYLTDDTAWLAVILSNNASDQFLPTLALPAHPKKHLRWGLAAALLRKRISDHSNGALDYYTRLAVSSKTRDALQRRVVAKSEKKKT